MVVFLFCFVALISYIAYFQAFRAHDLAAEQGNKRLWAKRNEVLRGTIYDRNGTALTTGAKTGDLTQSRQYVNGDLYVHALGYVNQKYGLTGLEESYDEQLSTYSSVQTGLRSFLQDFSLDSLKKEFSTRDVEENKIGNGVITTLDPTLQKIAYDALGDNRGAVVALDPKTGEVLAMVSKPTYDPNNLDAAMSAANAGIAENSPFLNRAAGGLYPPGSTFKTVTTSSALTNITGVTSKTFQDNGKIQFNATQSLSNAGGNVYGTIDLKKAFIVSSNVVFGGLAQELGNAKLKATAEKFGFNNTIPAEGFSITKSQFPTLESYEAGMIAQSGIGQSSILSTPMQMALVASAIANDGVMMNPTLVKEVIDMNGNSVKKIVPKKYGQVIPSADAATITGYMTGMMIDHNWALFNGLNAAGKTGTADHLKVDGTSDKAHSWFIGFAPADNPKIAVAVIVENGGFGAEAAAPIVGKIMKAAVNR
jgi:cell division protein FtsI/penicillin-binding protein 2